MGYDSKNELDFLIGLVNLISGKKKGETSIDAFGLLNNVKRESTCYLKIKTIKICFILEDGTHMHKDIDWEDL